MGLDLTRVRAILFDYGNTLVPFSRPQVEACDAALAVALDRLFGTVDRGRLKAIRDADRVAPYRNGLRENHLPGLVGNLVRELCGAEPTDDELNALLRVRFDAVVEALAAPPYLHGVLDALSGWYALGLVSNYPDGAAIRASLDRLGLTRYFGAVVVSADVGRVKPHPLPFRTCLDALHVAPEEALYVGDNWLADVQGARRLGMQMARSVQYEAPERFDPQPGDLEPDVVFDHLEQLPALVGAEDAPRGVKT